MNKKIKFKTKEIHSNLFLQSSRQTGTYALYYNARESLQKRNTPLVGVVQTVLQKSIMLRILADRMIKRLPHDRYLLAHLVDARGAALLAQADVEDQVLQLLRCS